jgi:hypothetical protein
VARKLGRTFVIMPSKAHYYAHPNHPSTKAPKIVCPRGPIRGCSVASSGAFSGACSRAVVRQRLPAVNDTCRQEVAHRGFVEEEEKKEKRKKGKKLGRSSNLPLTPVRADVPEVGRIRLSGRALISRTVEGAFWVGVDG